MIVPGVEAIIAKAKTDGKQPADIMAECYAIAQTNLAQASTLQKLHNDAKPAGNVPAGDAPNVKVDDKQTKGIKLLTQAQTNLHNRNKRFQVANGNGAK
jgi:hypothetical protein